MTNFQVLYVTLNAHQWENYALFGVFILWLGIIRVMQVRAKRKRARQSSLNVELLEALRVAQEAHRQQLRELQESFNVLNDLVDVVYDNAEQDAALSMQEKLLLEVFNERGQANAPSTTNTQEG